MRSIARLTALIGLVALGAVASPAAAQPPAAPAGPPGTFLLTIFLKHDQSKPLDQITEQLRNQKYYETFPPDGIEVVSWYVMMGVGQVVTLRGFRRSQLSTRLRRFAHAHQLPREDRDVLRRCRLLTRYEDAEDEVD